MASSRKPYRVAWISPNVTVCDHLLAGFSQVCFEQDYVPEVVRIEEFDLLSVTDCDRIVLVSPSRAEYPHTAVAALTCSSNIVPWAVVTDSWYLGSRRSGDGPMTHWQQPWFRWFDSWLGWFFPEIARPGSLVSNALGALITPMDFAHPTGEFTREPRNLQVDILCACPQTADMLHQQVLQAGWQARAYLSVQAWPSLHDSLPDVLVWDDSLLPCLPGSQPEPVAELVHQLTTAMPVTGLVASLALSRLHLYSTLHELGCHDLLFKPSHALPLSNLLYYRSLQRQVAWQQVQAIDD